MSQWWSTASIRVRLTAWYTAVLALMLIAYAAATYIAVRHEFFEQLEEEAHIEAGQAAPSPEARVDQQLGEILLVLVLGLPVIVVLAGGGGYLLAQRALAPIEQLAVEARRITADRLHERLSVPNAHDEIGRLAAVINETFARLESSFEQLRRFTADASHELRTPLSVIRGIGELGLRETRTPQEYKDTVGSMLEEVDRLTRLVDTLLQLSRGDAGTIRLSREVIDLGDLVRDVVSSLGILAEERQQRIDIATAANVRVSVDRLVLRDAVTNLVDNAIKYSPNRSTIAIAVDGERANATVTVADQGGGIPQEHRERIFDRFYRIDEGRSREMGGTGLGLAIAKWAIEAHEGSITVDNGVKGGAVFRVSLPLIPAASSARESGDRRQGVTT